MRRNTRRHYGGGIRRPPNGHGADAYSASSSFVWNRQRCDSSVSINSAPIPANPWVQRRSPIKDTATTCPYFEKAVSIDGQVLAAGAAGADGGEFVMLVHVALASSRLIVSTFRRIRGAVDDTRRSTLPTGTLTGSLPEWSTPCVHRRCDLGRLGERRIAGMPGATGKVDPWVSGGCLRADQGSVGLPGTPAFKPTDFRRRPVPA